MNQHRKAVASDQTAATGGPAGPGDGHQDQSQGGEEYQSFRSAILLLLADAKRPISIEELEAGVGRYMPAPIKGTVEDDAKVLLFEGLIARPQDDPRKVMLSASGKRLVKVFTAQEAPPST
jgi:hypothetical protein